MATSDMPAGKPTIKTEKDAIVCLTEALTMLGGSLAEANEPGLHDDDRRLEGLIRSTIIFLNQPAGGAPDKSDILNQISLEADRARTLLKMARAALNECDGIPDVWTYFERTMADHLDRIEALAEGRVEG